MSPQSPLESAEVAPASTPVEHTPEWEFRNQRSVVLYEALTARVGHRDALLWQSPSLAMTAEAFLMTIALAHDSSAFARVVAAFLGLSVSFLSIQLMVKHRLYLWNDILSMVVLEKKMNLAASAVDYRTQRRFLETEESKDILEDLEPRRKNVLTRLISVNVWICGLSFFGLINLLVLLYFGAVALGWAPEIYLF